MLAVGGLSLKPPEWQAGWLATQKPAVMQQAVQSASPPGRARQNQLEQLLAPPPVLVWSRLPAAPAKPGTSKTAPLLPEEAKPLPVLVIDPVYIRNLPDLRALPAGERKQQFIGLMLPLILRANAEVEERRQLVRQAAERGDRATLQQWAELYQLDSSDMGFQQLRLELLKRVDTLPVALVLSQAAVESGWGTSRFSIQGNALFGQRAWTKSAGIRPAKAEHARVVVRSFDSIFASVRSYLQNINTHYAYAELRERRHQLRQTGSAIKAEMLLPWLGAYSEEGSAYLETLKQVISSNDLERYNSAILQQKATR